MQQRHRHGRPRHRAPRHGPRPRPAVGLPAEAGAATDVLTGPDTAMAAHSARTARRREYLRALAGVLMTPWFAMGVGLAAAASLSLVVSRPPALSLPPARIDVCTSGCGSPLGLSGKGAHHLVGQSPAAGQSRPTPLPTSSSAASPPVVRLHFGLLPNLAPNGRGARHRFMAAIVIVGNKRLTSWDLRFRLPGAEIGYVVGSRGWSIDSSGIVNVHGAPPQWSRSDDRQAKLIIIGTGRPTWPTGCVFDKYRCTFSRLTKRERNGAPAPRPGNSGQPGTAGHDQGNVRSGRRSA